MARTAAIGVQSFEEIRKGNCFYVDKTNFIKEWWESQDTVTLIIRPRRFGKTLNMNMLETFFSVDYANRGDLFEGLSIWKEEKYRELQETYPVIMLSFANVKETSYDITIYRICQLLKKVLEQHSYVLNSEKLSVGEKEYFRQMTTDMDEEDAPLVLYQMCDFLYRYYGKKPIILLDEYDTPMQDAYATSFAFTEEEVFASLDEYGYSDQKQLVKYWYDGFIFGAQRDIYNPWSIINYLREKNCAFTGQIPAPMVW